MVGKRPIVTANLNELILTTLSLSRRVFMSDTNNLKVTYSLDMKLKLSAKDEQLATIRERQKRQRKEELYSYPPRSYPVCEKL